MNILVYVEPHPIRDNLLEFSWIAENLVKMLKDEYKYKKFTKSRINIKLLCSRYIHAEIIKHLNDVDLNQYIIGLTKEENDFILKQYHRKWDEEQLLVWKELLTGIGEVSEYYENILERVYSAYHFDTIVYWGTNGAIRNFSKKYSIPSIAMELGCTRKPFFESAYLDFMGVNGGSYTQHINLNNIQTVYAIEEIRTFLPITQSMQKSFDSIHDVLEHPLANKIYENIGKNILIPLQLMDDANILLFSRFNSMLEYLQYILPKLTDAGYHCYVKPHPGNIVRTINNQDHMSCKKYCETIPQVYWLDKFDNNKALLSLYTKMDYFVVINSSVGFEAMLLGKVVIPMGMSPYNIGKVLPTFNDFLEQKIDINIYKSNIEKIVNLLMFHYLYFKDDVFNFSGFINGVKFNRELYFLYQEDIEKFEKLVLSENIQRQVSYLEYPPRETVVKEKDIVNKVSRVANSIQNNKLFSDNLKYKLKRTPIIGSLLLRMKNALIINKSFDS